MPDRKIVRPQQGSSKLSMDGNFPQPAAGRTIGRDGGGLEHIGMSHVSVSAGLRHYLNFRK